MIWRSSKNGGWALCLAGLLLSLGAAGAQGKGQSVEVRGVSPRLLDTEPGRILSLAFRITHRGEGEEEFLESFELPPDWQAVLPSGGFVLPAAGETTRLFAFRVPALMAAGSYEVTYSLRSRRDPAIQDADTITVVVLPVTQFQLLLEEKPTSAIAGEEYQVGLRLVNQGNVALEIRLEVASEENYPAAIKPTETRLTAGGSEMVVVNVGTNAREVRPRSHVVQVKARTEKEDGEQMQTGVTTVVDIIPRVTGQTDRYHRLPARLSFTLHGEDSDPGLQVELSGEGTLTEEGTERIGFF